MALLRMLRDLSYLLAPLIVGFVLPPCSVAEQSTSHDLSAERTVVDESHSEIVKWCSITGNEVRYAAASQPLSGFRRCGKLTAQVSKIDRGRYSPWRERLSNRNPYFVFSRRPNTQKARNLPTKDTVDTSHMVKPGEEIEPLTPDEEQELEAEFAQIKKNNEADRLREIQALGIGFIQV